MRKGIVILLVFVMVGSVVAGLLAYLVPALQKEDVPAPSIKSYRFADLTGRDMTAADLSMVSAPEAETFTFDTTTRWPAAEKMPSGFSPDTVMEKARYLGLGLKSLHDRGITGRGVSVAIIDKPTIKEHEGLPRNLDYFEMKPGDPGTAQTGFHGAVAAAILAGKDGVAPDARVYYFAVPDDSEPYARYAEAMTRLIEVNKGLAAGQKVKAVVVPYGADPVDEAKGVGGAKEWSAAVKAARDEGMIVLYPGMPDLDYTGAGAPPGKDREDAGSYRAWTWIQAKAEVLKKVKDSGARSWDSARKALIRMLTQDQDLDFLRAEAINTYIYLMDSYKKAMTFERWLEAPSGDLSNTVAFPVDYITVPGVGGKGAYTYYGSGGLTWATSYVAGVLALGLQVKPDASAGELFRALKDTGTPFETGGKLVSPAGFVDAVR